MNRFPSSASPVPPHEECWAKTTREGRPGICVRDHCLNVGSVAEALLASFLPQLKELFPPGAVTLSALHDIGKVSPGFQIKSQSWLAQHPMDLGVWESDHAKVSQATVQKLLRSSRLSLWAAVVGAHHGRIKGDRLLLREPWEEERGRLAKELINEFGLLPEEAPEGSTIWIMAGLITIADWIGSDENHFPQAAQWDVSKRRAQARATLATIKWGSVKVRESRAFSDLFPEIHKANNLQVATLGVVADQGTYIIEGPMGSGKTEAALAAAHRLLISKKATGIYFALPTQVTSNRIHLRMQPFIERICSAQAEVRLAHSSSWLTESKPPVHLSPAVPGDCEAREHVHSGRSWFASSKRALLAPFGVGTIDQALLGVVAAKHFFVRQFGLAGKVVILDEVHTYDLYTSTLIDVLVQQLRKLHCTIIVLSATLTEKRRRELLGVDNRVPLSTDYPLISGAGVSFIERTCDPSPSKTIQIRHISGGLPVEEAMEHAHQGECILWIRNTVDEAQETFRALKSASLQDGPRIALLHSRFPFFRREQLEADWMTRLGKESRNRPKGCILVSTQVAEQSVDIDADLLITDLAPTDMLLQRLGRLWRHERPTRSGLHPEVWVQMPHDDGALRVIDEKEILKTLGKTARVYAPYVLLRSFDEWRTRRTITLPDDIRTILEATYRNPSSEEPSAWNKLRRQLESQKKKMTELALTATRIWANPALQDDEGVQTRFSSYPMARLLVATGITPVDSHSVRLNLLDGTVVTANEQNWNFEVAKAIYRNLVPLPRWAVAASLGECPRWLVTHVTSPTAVGLLTRDGSLRWPGNESPTGLFYDPQQGIIINREGVKHVHFEEFDESYD